MDRIVRISYRYNGKEIASRRVETVEQVPYKEVLIAGQFYRVDHVDGYVKPGELLVDLTFFGPGKPPEVA